MELPLATYGTASGPLVSCEVLALAQRLVRVHRKWAIAVI
jgi:hypothetical protein